MPPRPHAATAARNQACTRARRRMPPLHGLACGCRSIPSPFFPKHACLQVTPPRDRCELGHVAYRATHATHMRGDPRVACAATHATHCRQGDGVQVQNLKPKLYF
eukprot:356346-Chlamydomonas_euryale.AAC.6